MAIGSTVINENDIIIMNYQEPNDQEPIDDQQLNQEGEDSPICRVCHAEIDPIAELEDLLCPCHCIGSMAYIHRECFINMNSDRCQVCRFHYIAAQAPNPAPENPFIQQFQFQFDFNPENRQQQFADLINQQANLLPEQDPNTGFPIRQLYQRLGNTLIDYSLELRHRWSCHWSVLVTFLWFINHLARLRANRLMNSLFNIFLVNIFFTVITLMTLPFLYLGHLIKDYSAQILRSLVAATMIRAALFIYQHGLEEFRYQCLLMTIPFLQQLPDLYAV